MNDRGRRLQSLDEASYCWPVRPVRTVRPVWPVRCFYEPKIFHWDGECDGRSLLISFSLTRRTDEREQADGYWWP